MGRFERCVIIRTERNVVCRPVFLLFYCRLCVQYFFGDLHVELNVKNAVLCLLVSIAWRPWPTLQISPSTPRNGWKFVSSPDSGTRQRKQNFLHSAPFRRSSRSTGPATSSNTADPTRTGPWYGDLPCRIISRATATPRRQWEQQKNRWSRRWQTTTCRRTVSVERCWNFATRQVPAAGRQPRCYSSLLSFLSPPTTACYLRPTGETSRRPTTYRDQRPDQNMLQQGRPPATGVTPRHGGPNPSTKRLSTKRWPHVGIIVEVGRNSVRPRSYPVLLASSSLLWRNRRHLRPKRIASLGEEEKRNERTSARPRWTTCARNSPMQPTGANERPRRSETSKRILKRYVDFEMSSNSTFVPQYDTRAVTRGWTSYRHRSVPQVPPPDITY